MTIFDLYGLQNTTLEGARVAVEAALGAGLVAHESGYHAGAYYRLGRTGSEHFILQRNYDDFEEEWMEPEFKEYPYLLYVNETRRAPELEKRLTDVGCLLKRQEA